jgi:hypothetical protein
MKKILSFVVFAFLASVGPVHAQGVPTAAQIANMDRQMMNLRLNFALAQATATDPVAPYSAARSIGKTGLAATASGDVALASRGIVTVAGKPLIVDVAAKFAKADILPALGRFAVKVNPYVNGGLALFMLAEELGFVSQSPANSVPQFFKKTEGPNCVSDVCYEYRYSGIDPWVGKVATACSQIKDLNGKAFTVKSSGGSNQPFCELSQDYWGNGNFSSTFLGISVRVVPPVIFATLTPVPTQDFLDQIAAKSGWPTSSNLADITRDLIYSGETIPASTPTVSGPASAPGPQTVTRNSDGTTTTINTTTNYTYEGNNINTSVTNNTTNNNPVTNTTTSSSSVTTNPDTPPDQGLISDTPLPGPPVLYKPKYPDGLTGVWATRIADIKSSPLFNAAANLMPSIAAGGSCPVWMLPLNVGIKDFGTHDVAPPCWIWTFGKFVIVVSALLLARSLIFGG